MVKYFMGYDKGERLRKTRKVLKTWGRPLSHIFSSRPPPKSGKNCLKQPPFSHPPPPSHY